MNPRSYFLHNALIPTAARGPTYSVKEGIVVITARGVPPGAVYPVEVRTLAVPAGARQAIEYWGPLFRNGCRVAITDTNTQLVEMIRGDYRIVIDPQLPAPELVIALNEEERDNEDQVQYNYTFPASCPPQGGGGGGECPPALNFVDGSGQWVCDATNTTFWIEAVTDAATGVKTWSYLSYPGGPIFAPVLPIQPCSVPANPNSAPYQDRSSGAQTGAYAVTLGAGQLRSYTLMVRAGSVTRTNGPDAGVVYPVGTYSWSAPHNDGNSGEFPVLPAFSASPASEFIVLWTEG